MTSFRTLDDVDVTGKKVVVRVDLNVPLDGGQVRDATRIERIIPTLKELLGKNAVVNLLAHFGRPKGRVVADMSLAPVATALGERLGHGVTFVATDWRDGKAQSAAGNAAPGDVLLMENIRFHPGEEANDAAFSEMLAGLGDIYVNDAFSAAHRGHASTQGIAAHLPAVAGRAMQGELDALERALSSPARPLAAVVGGAKISSKLELLGHLSALADIIIIGGGMANTFLAAQGHDVGNSLCEHDLIATAKDIMSSADGKGCTIMLPVDGVVAREFKAGADNRVAGNDDIGADEMILDAGPRSIEAINGVFDSAATLVWNGPFGAFEIEPFDKATMATARHAAKLTKAGKLVSIAGGGDTVAALNQAGAGDDFTYVSTAGGAFLEWLEGKPLAGVKVLQK